MSTPATSLTAFHRVGDRSGLDPARAEPHGMKPALFANYRDLARIRHDYPAVLVEHPADEAWVKSLTDVINGILHDVATEGSEGEEMRRQVLCLEQEIRGLLAEGQSGSLSLFWEAARRRLVGDGSDSNASTQGLEQNLSLAREALSLDGELVDCASDLAFKLVSRAWREAEGEKATILRRKVVRLAQKLTDILEVDFTHSSRAREPENLESTMGSANQSVFDFQAMAQILRTAPRAEPLPPRRAERIRDAIAVLKTQRFVSTADNEANTDTQTFEFAFTDPELAVAAYKERLPAMAELIRAISIAQLEIENRYDQTRHDTFFANFDESRLGPSDLALFPGYLVCIRLAGDSDVLPILDVLRRGLPFNIVAQSDDILDDDSIDGTRLAFGARGQQLARMAVGLDRVFVMQAASSTLYRLHHDIFRGLQAECPTLFSFYSGQGYLQTGEDSQQQSHYLLAAAAIESRVFPCFTYDPTAGRGQASRFSMEGNPQPGQDWVFHALQYEDGEHTRHAEEVAFTPVDFIGAFPQFEGRYACVARDKWDDDMVPLTDFLALEPEQRAHKVPYVLMMDQQATLQRAVFDTLLIDAVERCQEAWRSLKELAGLDNSHVAEALDQAQQVWDEEKAKIETAAIQVEAATSPQPEARAEVAEPAPTSAAPIVEENIAPDSDDPWIETIRCTTCNECTQLNDRLFAYNEDQRAYVADPDAGTYRELVEAAESCQVAIIHPGKPRNPDEPGLEELIERAAPFH